MLVQFLKYSMQSAIKRDLLLYECCRLFLEMKYSRCKVDLLLIQKVYLFM